MAKLEDLSKALEPFLPIAQGKDATILADVLLIIERMSKNPKVFSKIDDNRLLVHAIALYILLTDLIGKRPENQSFVNLVNSLKVTKLELPPYLSTQFFGQLPEPKEVLEDKPPTKPHHSRDS